MGELGELTEQAHYNVGALAAMLGVDFVAAVGEKAELIAEGCMESGGTALHFDSRESALRTLTAQFTPHTAMLVKASHAMRFGEIVEELRKTYD